jgi:membrane-associated phospholipid phosphatase
MAPLTIRPTRLDRVIADLAEELATPMLERPVRVLTYGADEHVLLAASLGYWLVSRGRGARSRQAANYLLVNVAVSAVLPHILKRLVDQERPDRLVHGRRHGIPVSGKAKDAFPSGHAVHIGAIASALSRYFPQSQRVAWSVGAGLAVTRILLLAHWTTDVVAGLTLGASLERTVWAFWQAASSRIRLRSGGRPGTLFTPKVSSARTSDRIKDRSSAS